MYEKLPYVRAPSKSEKEWLLRVQRRNAVFDRLLSDSKFAALTQSSILIGLDESLNVMRLPNVSNSQSLFRMSPITEGLGTKLLLRYEELDTVDYQRLELAFQSFTSGILLAFKEVDSPDILRGVWELKKWFFRVGSTQSGVDTACAYAKYLSKLAQALFLRVPLPERQVQFPKESIYERVESFKHIGNMIKEGGRTLPMTKKTAYQLSQLAAMTRAGPYPSNRMVCDMVNNTLNMVSEPKPSDRKAIQGHRGGLTKIYDRLQAPASLEVHVSLSGSGAYELPRTEGGKGAYMAEFARTLSNCPIEKDELKQVAGLYDCFGLEVINLNVARSASRDVAEGKTTTWGDVLYVPFIEYPRNDRKEGRVPFGLASILLLVASQDLLKFGKYNQELIENPIKMPLFREKAGIEFEPNIDAIPVKAGLSIESAGKSRLVTSNPAAYTQIGQCINHFMRNWLSTDPFCRVGFEEADKLWEVLKGYSKHYDKGAFKKAED